MIKISKVSTWSLMSSVLVAVFCVEVGITLAQKKQIQNLRTFAKLFGYVRYFHPSDEASQIDWDKFAIYGTERVKDAKNSEELKSILEESFIPMAPTIQIYHANEEPRPFVVPEDNTDLKAVAWQHQGVGLGSSSHIYRSIRVNRENRVSTTDRGLARWRNRSMRWIIVARRSS